MRWDRANKCIHIEGGDFFGSMTRLRSRLLEHGYREVDRSGSGILVDVLLKSEGKAKTPDGAGGLGREPDRRRP